MRSNFIPCNVCSSYLAATGGVIFCTNAGISKNMILITRTLNPRRQLLLVCSSRGKELFPWLNLNLKSQVIKESILNLFIFYRFNNPFQKRTELNTLLASLQIKANLQISSGRICFAIRNQMSDGYVFICPFSPLIGFACFWFSVCIVYWLLSSLSLELSQLISSGLLP